MTWYSQKIESIKESVTDYKDIAVLNAVNEYTEELQIRIQILEGELDGKMWNPSRW